MQIFTFCISDPYPSKTPIFSFPKPRDYQNQILRAILPRMNLLSAPKTKFLTPPPRAQKSVSLLFTFSSYPSPHVQKLPIFGLPGPWGPQIWQLREILISPRVHASSGGGNLTSFQRSPKFHRFGGGGGGGSAGEAAELQYLAAFNTPRCGLEPAQDE